MGPNSVIPYSHPSARKPPRRPPASARGDDARLPRHRRRDRRHPQSDAVGPHRRDGSHHHRQRRADGARHRARKARRQEPADPRQGRDAPTSRSRPRQRHLLLLAARPSRRGHGRAGSTSRTSRRAVRRRAAGGERAARSTSISRPARSRTGRRPATRSSSSRAMATGAADSADARPVGAYWVSSGVAGSARKGTLSSAPFEVTHPYASFLVSGGAFTSTRVEIVLADDKQASSPISGADQPRLRPAVVDLKAYAGQATSSSGSSTRRPARRPRPTSRRVPGRTSTSTTSASTSRGRSSRTRSRRPR